MPAGQPDELGPERPPRRADRGLGQRGLVLVAHHDQQRAPYPRGQPAGPADRQAQRRTGRDLLPPVRVPAARVERGAAVGRVGRGEQRDRPRRAAQRHQPRRAARQAAQRVEYGQAGEAQHRERLLVARRIAGGGRVVGVRRLGDRRGQPRVARREREDVPARGRKGPDREPGRVDLRQPGRERDRSPPVLELLPDPHHLARLAAALAQVAVVEGQDREPGLLEPLCELVGARLLGHREPARHDHACPVGARIVPGGAFRATDNKPNLLPFPVPVHAVLRAD